MRSELVEAFVALRERGVRVTTATGRPIRFQLEILPANGLGAAVGTPQALMVDERELFLLDETSGRYEPHAAWNETIRARWERLHPRAMEWLRRTQAEAPGRGWECSMNEEERRMYERGLPTLTFKDAAQAAEARKWLTGELSESGDGLHVNRNNRLLQIQDAAVGKGNTLRALTGLWEIAPAEVLAVGDSANDFSMLDGRLGFRAGAPGNADGGIKEAVGAAGGYVAEERGGLGVLEVLRHYGLV